MLSSGVFVSKWLTARRRGELTLHEQKNRGGAAHVLWAHEVPPVVFEGREQWQRTATTITISAAADKQIRRLNLLRFGLTTQAV